MGEESRWHRLVRLWGPDPAGEIDDELEFHLLMREQELVAGGMGEAEARREARRSFGDRERIEMQLEEIGRRRLQRARRTSWLDDVRVDVRHGWRSFVRRPGIPLVVVVTLALGIGAGTAVFSLCDAVVLNPIAVQRPAELVQLYDGEATARQGMGFAYPMLQRLRERSTQATGIAGKAEMSVGFRAGEYAEQLTAAVVTGNYFELLGVRPQHGRLLQSSDESAPGTTPHAVISDGLWRRVFGADPTVVGRSVIVNEATFTVVGIAPPRFRGTELSAPTEVWIPITMVREIGGGGLFSASNVLETWFFSFVDVFARLPSPARLDAALAELRTIHAAAVQDLPETQQLMGVGETPPTTVVALPLSEAVGGRSRADLLRFLAVLAGVVAVSLAIACVNVANLMLIRATERMRELSIRAATGANAGRLVRQLLTENVVLGIVAGVAGLGVALGSMRLLTAFTLPGGIALTDMSLPLDVRVLGFTTAVSLACALAFGLAPALLGARPDVMQALRQTPGEGRGRLRSGGPLIAAQVALSLVLLVAGFLFLRSLQSALSVDLGFRSEGVASVAVGLRQHGYRPPQLVSFVDDVLAEVRARPGIAAAAAATHVPVDPDGLRFFLTPVGSPPGVRGPRIPPIVTTPGYLDLLEVPMVSGRDFSPADDADAPKVAIVTEGAARALWPGQDPMGKQFVAMFGDPYTVIGVARDAHFTRLNEREPHVFLPLAQAPGLRAMERLRLVARGDDGARATAALRGAVRAVDPRLPTFQERDIEQQIRDVLMPQRFGTMLLTVFGMMSLLISGVGIYAVVSYDVARRRRELGIRAALGAQRDELVHTVLRRSGIAICAGAASGLAMAAATSRTLRGLLFGIETYEPLSYLLAAATLAVFATFAAWLPARRAARIDPMKVIRE